MKMSNMSLATAVAAGRSDVMVVVIHPNMRHSKVLSKVLGTYYYPGPIHDTFTKIDYVAEVKKMMMLFKGLSKHNLYKVGYSG
jgi:hypothetical protein